jgi:hypothetical protein
MIANDVIEQELQHAPGAAICTLREARLRLTGGCSD